jgi:hypothetical protein
MRLALLKIKKQKSNNNEIFMKQYLAIIILFSIATAAHAQTALQDQINAVDNVQRQNNADQERLAIKAQAERSAIRQKREDEFRKDKQREQAYEDELRHVEVEAQKTQLSVMKAKANRANDYIDQELNKEKAKTDVIQSQADATRNV